VVYLLEKGPSPPKVTLHLGLLAGDGDELAKVASLGAGDLDALLQELLERGDLYDLILHWRIRWGSYDPHKLFIKVYLNINPKLTLHCFFLLGKTIYRSYLDKSRAQTRTEQPVIVPPRHGTPRRG
jgi:hypothetical protein